eukprot:s4548_g4.t1
MQVSKVLQVQNQSLREKVLRSLNALVELKNDPRILSVQVIGNGSHTNYNLPPPYNREMGKHFTWLAQNGINGISSGLLATGSKYDNYHLIDRSFNRKLVFTFLRGVITFHLKYVEIMTEKEELRWFAANFIVDDNDRREAVRLFPTIIQFRLALARTHEVMNALTSKEQTATPAEEFDKADEEILIWVHAGIKDAEEEATREDRPVATTFTDEEIASIVPVDPQLEDAETEEQRARLYLREDLAEAERDGFSIATVESIELPGSIDDEVDLDDVEVVPDVDDWDLIVGDPRPSGTPSTKRSRRTRLRLIGPRKLKDLNKILTLTSATAMPSGTSAGEKTFTRMEGSVTVHPDMEGSVEVIPMEVDETATDRKEEKSGDAPRRVSRSSAAAKADQPG